MKSTAKIYTTYDVVLHIALSIRSYFIEFLFVLAFADIFLSFYCSPSLSLCLSVSPPFLFSFSLRPFVLFAPSTNLRSMISPAYTTYKSLRCCCCCSSQTALQFANIDGFVAFFKQFICGSIEFLPREIINIEPLYNLPLFIHNADGE